MSNEATSLGLAPAVLGFVMVHATLRRDASELVAAAGRTTPRGLEGRVALFDRVLSVHHRGEEDLLLPALRERQPGFLATSALIEGQHIELDRAVKKLTLAVHHETSEVRSERAAETRRLLEEHLSTEEQHLLPVWAESFSVAEQEEFAATLRRSTPFRDVGVMVPWLLEATPVEFRELATSQLPLAVRLVHRIWWRQRFLRAYDLAA